MPQNKDLKRLVRSRMKKTGESYTAARTQLTRKKTRAKATPTTGPVIAVIDYAALAGMTDAAIEKGSGCTWETWVYVLDRAGAMDMTHAEIAKLVHEKWKVPGWWCQSVTVGYERIKGRRQRGQRCDGAWEASKSRTIAVPIDDLFEAWADAKTRRRWLPEKLTVRKATTNRSMRITWADGTSVELWFQAKGDDRSAVGVQHTKLTSKADADARKKFWAERLSALDELLTG